MTPTLSNNRTVTIIPAEPGYAVATAYGCAPNEFDHKPVIAWQVDTYWHGGGFRSHVTPITVEEGATEPNPYEDTLLKKPDGTYSWPTGGCELPNVSRALEFIGKCQREKSEQQERMLQEQGDDPEYQKMVRALQLVINKPGKGDKRMLADANRQLAYKIMVEHGGGVDKARNVRPELRAAVTAACHAAVEKETCPRVRRRKAVSHDQHSNQ